jgi:NAD(P)-dependent dehydrogenase (short-subunit alcohol dehydrogenase family)
MQGKQVIITGGAAGIGKAAARALAAQGAAVTLLGRSSQRGEAAAKEIRKATGNAAVSALACDLGSPADVRRAAAEFSAAHPRLDVLLNNAGVFLPRREVNAAGQEKTFASIYLGHFLLTRLLLPQLQAAPQGRIVCVTCPPGQAKVQFDDLSLSRNYSTLKAQFQAKGALYMFVRELVTRLQGSAVTANTMLPGLMIKTDLLKDMPAWMRLPVQWFGMSPERGAEPEVWLAGAPELATVSGRHFHGRKEQALSGQITDAAACRRLWELSSELVGLPKS